MAVEDAVAPYLDFELARMHNCYFASTWSGVPMHARAGIRSLQDRWDAYRLRPYRPQSYPIPFKDAEYYSSDNATSIARNTS